MSLQFDPEKVRLNARQASTEELLDRITVYREGMEPQAVVIIEEELFSRGIGESQIMAHALKYADEELPRAGGFPRQCCLCNRPAVTGKWSWHRMWGIVPLFPRYFWFCKEHAEPLDSNQNEEIWSE